MAGLRVQVDTSGLRQFKELLDNDLRQKQNGPIREIVHEWSRMYRGWLRQRYARYSGGGGDWQPLAAATIRRKGHALILRDTDFMFEVFDPSAERKPGLLNQDIPFGITVGFGSDATHPTANMPVDELARIHQLGLGNVPAREIIVGPSLNLQSKMVERAEEMLQEVIDDVL